jgi:hypothetical protein
LWLACYRCNEFKGDRTDAFDAETQTRVALFNPRQQIWKEHFSWSVSGTHLPGLTACERATIEALRLNNDLVVGARRFWTEAGWHPPPD